MAINLGTIFAQIGLDTSLLKAGVSKANAQLTKADKGIGGFVKRNQKVLLGFGVAGATAVAAIGIASIKMAGDFDQSMRNVNTITKLTEEQLNSLKEEVIDLSREVPLTTQQLTEGLFNVASAGVEAADQMNFLTESSKAAVAGQADLATTVKGLTGVIKGYGDEFSNVDKVADLFFKTNELGVTTFEELAGSMGKVVPLASALGVTQEELFATMATLTGVTGNTSEVVTQLKAAFTSLIKPTEKAKIEAAKLGISFDATSIQSLGLAGFLEQVQEATGGNVGQMGKLFESVEGLSVILALTGSSSDKFADNLVAMGDAAGAANDAFSEQQKGLNNQLKVLKNNVNAIALDIGGKIIPKLTDFTTRINELDDETKDNIATSAEWGLATVGITGAISVLLVVGKRMLAFLGPWGKAIAAIVAITTTHFKITEKLASLIDNEWASSVVESISLIGSFKNSISTWTLATQFAEQENRSLISVLFMNRSELELLNEETEEAIEKGRSFRDTLEGEAVANRIIAGRLRETKQAQEELNAAVDEAVPKVDALGNEIDLLEIEANEATEAMILLRNAILNLPDPKVISIPPTIITGGVSAGQAARTTQTPITPTGSTAGNVVIPADIVIPRRLPQMIGGIFIPGLADGGMNLNAGQFLVGEKGPEIVKLQQGSSVIPNNQIGQGGGGSDIVVPVTVELDGDVIFQSVERRSNEEDFRRIN